MSNTLVKGKDVIVYRNEASYSHNAVVEQLQDGQLLVVIQEQNRRPLRSHNDPSSRAVLLRSTDGGNTWDPTTKTTVVDTPNEANNDPSIRQLSDGTLIVNYFTWRCGNEQEVPTEHAYVRTLDGIHYAWTTGTHTMRSSDGGSSWENPVTVPSPTGDDTLVSDPIIELPDGQLMIPLYASYPGEMDHVLVMRSQDGGRSWGEPTTVIRDLLGQMDFNEPSLLYLPSGKLICMMRAHRAREQEYGYFLYQSDSDDLGQTWSPVRRTLIWGHPPHLLRLQSGNILCVYGYRRPPYGVRACLSHDDGQTWDLENELILRCDGIDADVGYPTSIQLADGRIFTVWYLTEPPHDQKLSGHDHWVRASPLAYIGGTFLQEE